MDKCTYNDPHMVTPIKRLDGTTWYVCVDCHKYVSKKKTKDL